MAQKWVNIALVTVTILVAHDMFSLPNPYVTQLLELITIYTYTQRSKKKIENKRNLFPEIGVEILK